MSPITLAYGIPLTRQLLRMQQLQSCLEGSGIEWTLNPGDGAFYGPKVKLYVHAF